MQALRRSAGLLRHGKAVSNAADRARLIGQRTGSTQMFSAALGSTARPDDQSEARQGLRALTGLGFGALLVALGMGTGKEAENCGIVGVVGAEDARAILLEGLTVLQNRGYDSAGLATISPEKTLMVTKYASLGSTSDSIDLVKVNSMKHRGHHIGIAHTR